MAQIRPLPASGIQTGPTSTTRNAITHPEAVEMLRECHANAATWIKDLDISKRRAVTDHKRYEELDAEIDRLKKENADLTDELTRPKERL
ncbi:hypothetical protein W97_08002 [Coniosporium apollinis CBS 100218]|uniref:Uncharacterized protein n=1 Tax=Coniosporium apollinis (strain CBS 100218) TaxID=1168221 RepID=R7Z3Z5_CONA1|nr:uncharacterized protein W97_08002 [Coniosporium apollinis CBS 100218]EON68744.1 hypothetical protein W97_08002 [Coniosporium apollinis CBS 100218]